MMASILAPEHGDVVERIAWARALLAFDYDGTLAPYVEDRHTAEMRGETRALLRTAALLYPCAIVSGRARADVLPRLEGIPLAAVIGNHGAEPGFGPVDDRIRARVAAWAAELAPLVAGWNGVEVENKGFSLALHHRRARSWGDARARIRQLVSRLEGAIVFEGHAVVNVLPEDAPTKANAIRELCTRFALDVVVYVGDDRSDEEAFRCDAVSVSIRIGFVPSSSARFALSDQAEIDQLLRELVLARARLDGRKASSEGILRALRS